MRVRFALVWMFSAVSAFAQPAPLGGLDEFVARALKTFEVPGVGVAVVKDGAVVLAKGYGVRKTGQSDPVDSHTLFGIGSNTKAFTVAALGMLVDEGKLSWDDRVVDRMSDFQMYDPYVTHEMTIRDLLTHRSGLGLGAGDLLFSAVQLHARGDHSQAALHQPATSFRSRYAYDNLLYMVAGQIIPAVTGKPWEDFIRERIFNLAGMTDSNTSVTDFRPGGNVRSRIRKWRASSRSWRLRVSITPPRRARSIRAPPTWRRG